MRKIKTLYKLDQKGLAYDEVVEGCEWVIKGYGIATEKFDGTACLIKKGLLYKRYDLKPKKSCLFKKNKNIEYIREDFKEPPESFFECDDSALSKGHIYGWVLVNGNGENHQDKYHLEAMRNFEHPIAKSEGTYELVGPKIQGNPYKLDKHCLWKHGSVVLKNVPVSFLELKEFLRTFEGEGIVWHDIDDIRLIDENDNCDYSYEQEQYLESEIDKMVKIRKKDFFK